MQNIKNKTTSKKKKLENSLYKIDYMNFIYYNIKLPIYIFIFMIILIIILSII